MSAVDVDRYVTSAVAAEMIGCSASTLVPVRTSGFGNSKLVREHPKVQVVVWPIPFIETVAKMRLLGIPVLTAARLLHIGRIDEHGRLTIEIDTLATRTLERKAQDAER